MADKRRDIQIWLSLRDAFSKPLAVAGGRVHKFALAAKGAFSSLASLPGLIAGLAVIRIGKGFLDAASKIEVFHEQLRMVTKTAEEADQALSAIREFARTSPLETEDVVKSYVRLRAVGIAPTLAEMKNLGGVAVLFNRELSEVLDSFIGMNKKTLRQLGVEIDRTGSKAIIQSGNIRKVVGKDSASIRKALLEIWAERFPNAIEKAADTFTAQTAIMRSNWFEFQAQLGEKFLPQIKEVTKQFSDWIGEQSQKIDEIRVGILIIVAVWRTVFNAVQIVVDTLLAGVIQYGHAIVAVIKAVIKLGDVFAETFRNIGATWNAILAGDFLQIPIIWSDFGDVVKQVPEELMKGFENIVAVGDTFVESTKKNGGDIKNAWKSVANAMADVGKKKPAATELPADPNAPLAPEVDPKIAIREQIKLLEMRLEMNKFYSDLIIENTENEFKKRRLIVSQEMGESMDKVAIALEKGAITQQRAEDIKTEITKRAAQERQKIRREELAQNFDFAGRFVDSAAAVASAIVQINEDQKNRMKPLLYAQAVMRAAISTVTAVQAAWESSGGNYYLGVALSAAAVIQNVAMLAGQLQSINTAATGAAHTRAGTYMVGEHGPEMVRMPANAQIVPTHETRRMAQGQGSGGGITIAPVFNGPVDRQTGSAIMGELERIGKNVTRAIRGGYLDSRRMARYA